MNIKSITSHRGTWVILGLLIILATGVMIGILRNTSQLDNDKLNGFYSGTITIPNESLINMNITFDGQGSCSGTILIDSLALNFDDGFYECKNTSVQITIFFDHSIHSMIFIGDIEGDVSLIRGNVRKYENREVYTEGNFILSKLE